jgi:hypothetical protein
MLFMLLRRCEFSFDLADVGNTLRSIGRRVGMQAAMMMRAFSAPAVKRSSPTSKVGSVLVALALSLVHLMMAIAPALYDYVREIVLGTGSGQVRTRHRDSWQQLHQTFPYSSC